jgi:hypothetical protein
VSGPRVLFIAGSAADGSLADAKLAASVAQVLRAVVKLVR